MYSVDQNLLNENDYYGNFINNAYPHAKRIIEDYFVNILKFKKEELHWKQGEIRKVSFQHLCLTYKNQVFSFLLAAAKSANNNNSETEQQLIEIYLDKQDVSNQLRECKKNNIIPCYIVLYEKSFRPLIYPGNPIFLTETQQSLDVLSLDFNSKIKASDWELHELGIRCFIDKLPEFCTNNFTLNFNVTSTCDILGINPQIWSDAEMISSKEKIKDVFFMVRTFGPNIDEGIKALSLIDGYPKDSNNLCFGVTVTLIPTDGAPVVYRNSDVTVQYQFYSKENLLSIIQIKDDMIKKYTSNN